MMQLGRITARTRRFVHATDGGSENRAKLAHAISYLLVLFGVFDEVQWVRLPPGHSHDFVDRIFSAIEEWMQDPSHCGCATPFALRNYLMRRFMSERSKYAGTNVAIDILLATYDFDSWLHDAVNTSSFMIPQEKLPDGTTTRPEPLVWRYTMLGDGSVATHWKMSLAATSTEDRDEWGPWEDHITTTEDLLNGGTREMRVLRTKPAGEQYMVQIPSLLVNPGYDEYLDARFWSQSKVLSDVRKIHWPPGTPPGSAAVWETLCSWHEQNQRSNELGPLPVQWAEPHMVGCEMGTGFLEWHELWTTLLQFSPRAPPHGASAAAAAAAAHAAPSRCMPPLPSQPPPAAAAASATERQPPPRASEVNVVRSMAYTQEDALVAKLLTVGVTYVQDNWDMLGSPPPCSALCLF
mmetsp:Transcript_26037/g.82506  ORF Transcript_26037/g.82506 Transcript_26037/m.82506 type:complete len:408 (-) Transcript_26037:15-1238(-)